MVSQEQGRSNGETNAVTLGGGTLIVNAVPFGVTLILQAPLISANARSIPPEVAVAAVTIHAPTASQSH